MVNQIQRKDFDYVIDPKSDANLNRAIDRAVEIVGRLPDNVTAAFSFNGFLYPLTKQTTAAEVDHAYWGDYVGDREFLRAKARMKERAHIDEQVKDVVLELRDRAAWIELARKHAENLEASYMTATIMQSAERLGKFLQFQMNNGYRLEDVIAGSVKKACIDIDEKPAVKVLIETWRHGDQLRVIDEAYFIGLDKLPKPAERRDARLEA